MHQGTILRDCQHGTGLMNSNGNKYEFRLEDHWSSEEVPAAGMRVSFELNGAGQLFRVYSGDPDSALPVGTVLRDAQNGPGLVICAGKKYLFTLEKEWMSEVPPAAGMRVYVATTKAVSCKRCRLRSRQSTQLTVSPMLLPLRQHLCKPLPRLSLQRLQLRHLPPCQLLLHRHQLRPLRPWPSLQQLQQSAALHATRWWAQAMPSTLPAVTNFVELEPCIAHTVIKNYRTARRSAPDADRKPRLRPAQHRRHPPAGNVIAPSEAMPASAAIAAASSPSLRAHLLLTPL